MFFYQPNEQPIIPKLLYLLHPDEHTHVAPIDSALIMGYNSGWSFSIDSLPLDTYLQLHIIKNEWTDEIEKKRKKIDFKFDNFYKSSCVWFISPPVITKWIYEQFQSIRKLNK